MTIIYSRIVYVQSTYRVYYSVICTDIILFMNKYKILSCAHENNT